MARSNSCYDEQDEEYEHHFIDETQHQESSRMRHNSSSHSELPRMTNINTPRQLADALKVHGHTNSQQSNRGNGVRLHRTDSLTEASYTYGTALNLHTGYAAPPVNNQYLLLEIKEKDPTHSRYEVASKAVHREDSGLFSSNFLKRAIVMSLWFFCSFGSIVLNKYILSTLNVDAGILGETQILMTTFFGGIMMYLPICNSMKTASDRGQVINKYTFFKTVSLLGWLRCGAVICSVIGLKYVAVSFSETIKSSAPLFTAIVAYFLLGEYSGWYVNLSLLPIMFGLAISTSTELSFNMTGFLAAVTNNILDCIQNVFSKKLLTGKDLKFSPLELQFYTSVAATVVQMPIWFYFMDVHTTLHQLDHYTIYMLLFNSVIFYLQSLFAYLLMSLISPITFSVSNTVKRAGLIWFSVLVFNNEVSWLSAFGTCLVVLGVFLYQRARHMEAGKRTQIMKEKNEKIKKKVISI